MERPPLARRIEREREGPRSRQCRPAQQRLPPFGLPEAGMKTSMAPLAAWKEFGGPVVAFEMCEDVSATVNPCGIAEAADRADLRPGKLTGSEHGVLDRSDRASLGPTPPVVVALPRAGSPVSHGCFRACV